MTNSATGFYDRYWAFREQRGDTTAANRVKLRHEQAAAFFDRELLGQPAEAVAIADLGCGDGLLGQVLSNRGWSLTGFDVAPRALQLASPYYRQTQLLDMDADATPDDCVGAFDGVACLEVLEHIETPAQNIRRCREMLKPGGVVAMSYPNIFSWRNRLMFLRGRWPAGYTTYDPREHLQVFDLPRFRQMVGDAGLQWLGLEITPDLPRWKPLRRWMFRRRMLLGHMGASLWAMQINVYARRPG